MLTYIAGSGAMGCRFGASLAEIGEKVILLDNWDAHIQAIQQDGLKISGEIEKTIQIPIMRPEEAQEPADLIILFTKAMQLPDMLQSIKQIIHEDTKVLCLLNGLGHQDVISQYIPKEAIIMGVTVWTAALVGPGHVKLNGTGEVNLQSLEEEGAPVGRQVAELLSAAHLNATYDTDVFNSIWRKACVNGTMNSNCAVLDCTIGELFSTEDGEEIVNTTIKEFISIAKHENITVDEKSITDYVYKTSVKAAEHYPSMHQDLVQHKRMTEIDYLNGYISRKGKEYGIDTPYCDYVTQMIHLKESLLVK